MPNIEIIPIAKRKAAERGITEERIIEAINNPDQLVPGYGGRKVAHKKIVRNGKEYLLRIVFEEWHEKLVVVTAYATSQVSRYWLED